MWILITGDDLLSCEGEEHNKNYKDVVAIIGDDRDDYVSKKIVGHVLLNWR